MAGGKSGDYYAPDYVPSDHPEDLHDPNNPWLDPKQVDAAKRYQQQQKAGQQKAPIERSTVMQFIYKQHYQGMNQGDLSFEEWKMRRLNQTIEQRNQENAAIGWNAKPKDYTIKAGTSSTARQTGNL